jgi:phosphatidylethanolamine-binding protein (PEBP) family uncharacterized protein
MPANTSVKRHLALIESDPSKILGLKVGKHSVTPGLYIPKAGTYVPTWRCRADKIPEAQAIPELSINAPSFSGAYMVVHLDIDAPFPSLPVLGPILHWIQPGLKPSPGENGSSTLQTTDPFVTDYIGPAPPPGSGPHRYVFFLYEQPADFDGLKYAPPGGRKLSNLSRMWYSLDDWEKEAKLSPPVAVNFYTSN